MLSECIDIFYCIN